MSHQPRKRFGQHFLHDPAVIDRIIAAIDPRPGQHIVEIGPGLGVLTRPLLERCAELDVVELDRDLIPELERRCADAGQMQVHQADALSFDFCALAPPDARLRIVGNLPYNISTPLLFHLLGQAHCVQDMHFMLQREVVERMGATAGSKAYGRLSVMLAAQTQVEPLFRIGRGAFSPPPRVESAFVRLRPYEQPPFVIDDHELFANIVRQAFSHRRKTLRNALRGLLSAGQIVAAGADPDARPGTLSAATYARLAAAALEAREKDTRDVR